MQVKFENGVKDVSIYNAATNTYNVNAENYIVPEGEEMGYHCLIEIVEYDNKTGHRISRPRVQKFGAKSFDTFIRAELEKQGYTITILHDPTEWNRKRSEELARHRNMTIQQRAEEQQAERTRLREELKAEILAELGMAKKRRKKEEE